ncbi:MAG: hypothetical protein BGN86_03885 [Caulobacterales bacterium 68-7]|nr:GNAT family N-acetyltransferase [Caulobacterales bacterium]OJU11763.1 MAG: hypothetical protein BGN86_03885 [Caulobacterales bacterium 68-7]
MTDTLAQSGEITIRRATADDAEPLAALSAAMFLDTFVRGFGIPYSDADIEAFIASSHSPAAYAKKLADPDQALWIATDASGRAVGYANAGPCGLPAEGASADQGELYRLYVRREVQGAGLAARLMTETLAWLAADRRPVWLGVWSLNERAQRFYARYGFEKVGEYDYPVGETIDREWVMRREAGAL